jgi:hypothetical protein
MAQFLPPLHRLDCFDRELTVRIYHTNFDSRLGREFLPRVLARPSEAYFLILHPPSSSVESIRNSLTQYRADVRCQHVLCVKGARFAGFASLGKVVALEEEFGDWSHFLRYAVPDREPADHVVKLINSFLRDVEARGIVDWKRLYPAALPHLSSLWAQLAALSNLPAEIESKWRSDLTRNTRLWLDAAREYHEFTGRDFTNRVINLREEQLNDWANEIGRCLAELSLRHT